MCYGHALLDRWRSRHPRRHEKKQRPSWAERHLNRANARVAFVVGAAINLPGPLYLLALGDIATGGHNTAEQLSLIVLFNAITFLLVEIPLIGLPRATRSDRRAGRELRDLAQCQRPAGHGLAGRRGRRRPDRAGPRRSSRLRAPPGATQRYHTESGGKLPPAPQPQTALRANVPTLCAGRPTRRPCPGPASTARRASARRRRPPCFALGKLDARREPPLDAGASRQSPTWLAPIAFFDPVDPSSRSLRWRVASASAMSPTRVWSRRCRSSYPPGRSGSPDRRRHEADRRDGQALRRTPSEPCG